jgi:PAS domain S-box-containing protein
MGLRLRRNIVGDVILLVGGISLIAILAIGSFLFTLLTTTLEASLERTQERSSREIVRTLEPFLYTVDDMGARTVAEAYLGTGTFSGIRVESTASGIVLDRPPDRAAQRPRKELEIIRGDLVLGRVSLWFDEEELRLSNQRLLIVIVTFAGGILLTYILSMNLAFRAVLGRPLDAILRGIQTISSGDYSHRIGPDRHEDLNLLIDTINRMVENIVASRSLLEESERRYTALFDSSAAAIFLHDEGGRLIDVNQSMLRMFGLGSKEEALSFDIATDFSAQDNDLESLPPLWSEVMGGEEKVFPWTARRPLDGSIFPVEINLRRVQLSGGAFILASVMDVTERKRVEEQLIQAQKMEAVGTIAGGLAHDFNNILGGITGVVSLLQLEASQGKEIGREELADSLGLIEGASLRAANVVKKLLTLSRKQEKNLKDLDLRETMKHVMAIAVSTIDRSVEIRVHYPDASVPVRGDATQMEQVFLNLLVNASQSMTAMRPAEEAWGGRLSVDFSSIRADPAFMRAHPQAVADAYESISVTDTGVGMSREILSRIFTPFYTTKERGTGLGLAMAWNIVKDHGGFIDVHSEAGLGSRFTVYLPRGSGDAAPAEKAEDRSLAFRGRGLVLVVDDEELFRVNLGRILREFGYEVMEADNGVDGFLLFREHRGRIAFTLLDMAMKRQSGKETLEQIRKIDPGARVVLMSGFRLDPRVEAIMDSGAASLFLQKPFTLMGLVEVLERITAIAEG